MKQYTVRLNEDQVAMLDKVIATEHCKSAQQAFEIMIAHYLEMVGNVDYWEAQFYAMEDENKDKQKQIELLKELIYNLKLKG